MLKLDRRELLSGLVVSSAALVGVTPVLAQVPSAGWAPQALNAAQVRALEAYSEALMPTTDTPGGREAGVARFIDRALATYCDADEAEKLRAAVDRLDVDARRVHGRGFADLDPGQQAQLMAAWDQEVAQGRSPARQPFAMLKEYATVGFFTSRPGAQRTLRYDPVPGAFRGCVPLKEIGRGWAT